MKQVEEVKCDICGKPVVLTAGLMPPGLLLDNDEKKGYMVCGFCQFRLSKDTGLSLRVADNGFIIQEIRNGYGYIDMDKIMPKVKEYMAENFAKVY